MRIKISLAVVEIKYDELFLDNFEAIQIYSLSIFSNINLTKVLSNIYYKYLLLFDSTNTEKLSLSIIFQLKIKYTAESKNEKIYKLFTKELKVFK